MMLQTQMDADEFLYTDFDFYKHVIRTVFEKIGDGCHELHTSLVEKMDGIPHSGASDGQYLSVCNYLKRAKDFVEEIQRVYDGFDVYVSKICRSEICLRTQRPKMKSSNNNDRRETEEFMLVKTVLKKTICD